MPPSTTLYMSCLSALSYVRTLTQLPMSLCHGISLAKEAAQLSFQLGSLKERTKLFFSIALSSYLNEEGWLSVMQQSQPKTRGLFQGLELTLERPSSSSKVHWFEFSQLTGMPVKMKKIENFQPYSDNWLACNEYSWQPLIQNQHWKEGCKQWETSRSSIAWHR